MILKITRGGKNFSNKSKKNILVRFESFNNFIVYILEDNKVIITRDIVIKKELNYKNNYKLKKDYNIFLEIKSPDYNNYILIYNKESINNNNNDIYSDDKLSLSIILKQAKICRIADKEIISQNNDDLDKLDPNYRYTRSSKLPGPNINIIQSNIYNIASLAYLNSLNQGINIDFNFKNRENY